jgi:hypothetical protein
VSVTIERTRCDVWVPPVKCSYRLSSYLPDYGQYYLCSGGHIFLVSWLLGFLRLDPEEAVHSSETSMNVYRTTRHGIPEDDAHCCETRQNRHKINQGFSQRLTCHIQRECEVASTQGLRFKSRLEVQLFSQISLFSSVPSDMLGKREVKLSIYLRLFSPCGPWPHFSFLIYTQSVRLLGRGISTSQGRYLHITTE